MRVLITNLYVKYHSGSENVVELLAEGLRRAGHLPTIYAPVLGEQADAMRQRGLRLVDRIEQLTETPDIIHAQHLTPCLAAMARQFQELGFAGFCARWNRVHAWHGLSVRILDRGEVLHEGVAMGADDSGQLQLDTASGRIAVMSGDVSLRLKD